MPAADSLTTQNLKLPNGLTVSLCHAPRLKRCAAALRVAAGSHDVPQEWPGLAHFLEHLFFLGTDRFPAGEKLMAFVQRHGGQINASTRERTTDFFFELPQAVFADGLERLCEMLTHPRMALEDQLREREVLHAEFIAWSQDDAAQYQMKLLASVSSEHPLRWFHAGNRYSLAVPRQNFQHALQDFYHRFYQAGQITLSLAGPQPLAELRQTAERFGGMFSQGDAVEQIAPARLMDEPEAVLVSLDPGRMHLLFACEDLPDGAEEAVAFFLFWLGNVQPGGLAHELKSRGLAESLKAEVVYQFRGQVLLNIEVGLSTPFADKSAPSVRVHSPVGADLYAKADSQTPTTQQKDWVSALLYQWLSFFETHHAALHNEYALLQTRQLDVLGALKLARHFSERVRHSPGLSAQGSAALQRLLAQLKTMIPAHESASTDHPAWRLPQPNRLLRPVHHSTPPTANLPSLTFSRALPDSTGEGAVYLRWALSCSQPARWKMLNDSLKSLTEDAQQAGVDLAFTAYGNYWQLKLAGLTQVIPAVIDAALKYLTEPDAFTLARFGQPSNEPKLIPIRQLLKTLPDHVLNIPAQQASHKQDDLQSVWKTASWSGLALGLSTDEQNALNIALRKCPGASEYRAPQPLLPSTDLRWETETSDASEDAVLLFCPVPDRTLESEAAWRLLAHLAQTPFYQRLRVELQLGYAVFSGFRQIAGQSGILFGVQSPSATAQELGRHMRDFISGMRSLVESADITLQSRTLAAQFDVSEMDTRQATEQLWQAHLAGHDADYLQNMKHDLSNLHEADLMAAVDQLTNADSGWLYLSNRSRPVDV
jgi:secreted Zn-dependent insulinase-like peptidase